MGDPDQLAELIRAGGFCDVTVNSATFAASWSDLPGHFASSQELIRARRPTVTESELAAHLETVLSGFRPFMAGSSAQIPMTTVIATALAP